jgi:anti-sigma regulatory factor (Ser/Thr protein kinase)
VAIEDRPIKFAVRVSADQRAPALARRAIAALGTTTGDSTAANAQLLVSEIVTNSVRHAGLRPEDWIDIVVRRNARALRVEVRDWGGGFSGSSRSERADVTRGFGLVLVAGIADRWGIEGGPPTVVWFELDPDEAAFQGTDAGVSVTANSRT